MAKGVRVVAELRFGNDALEYGQDREDDLIITAVTRLYHDAEDYVAIVDVNGNKVGTVRRCEIRRQRNKNFSIV